MKMALILIAAIAGFNLACWGAVDYPSKWRLFRLAAGLIIYAAALVMVGIQILQ